MKGLAVAFLLLGCGAAPPPAPAGVAGPLPPPEIELLRARAAASPNDPPAWRSLAEGELLHAGGDTRRAGPAIARALQLSGRDPVLHLLAAVEHELHGRWPEAFVSYLDCIDHARGSRDPLAAAVAEVALGRIEGYRDDVPDWRQRALPVVERVLREPGPLGLLARYAAGSVAMNAALQRGDVAASRRIAGELGCVSQLRVAGPFGPQVLLGLDQSFSAEARGPLAEGYDLGPNRGRQSVRLEDTRHCSHYLGGGPLSLAGSFVAEAMIDVPVAADHTIAVQTPFAFRVRVDGREVGLVDTRRRVTSRWAMFTVPLAPGRHEIEVKVVARSDDPVLDLVIDRADRVAPGWRPDRGFALPEASSPLATVIRAWLAADRGDTLEARESLRVMDRPDATAVVHLALADAAGSDPFLPAGRRGDEALRRVRAAVARDPDTLQGALGIAQSEQGGLERAAALREIARRFPLGAIQLTLAGELQEAGSTEEAEQAVERARELAPASCRAIEVHEELLRGRSRIVEANALVEPLLACDARSYARLRMFYRQRRYDQVRIEIERLRPLLEERDMRALDLELAVATGEQAREQALRAEGARDFPYWTEPVIDEADRALARGDRPGAIAALDRMIDRAPRFGGQLRALRRTLSRDDWLERHRVDGSAALREFESSGRRYERHGQVLVLDYMVTRIFPDGSAISLVHQIQRVQSDESIEELGQLRLPGRVLTLRSIKPDGRRLEPDAIQGVDHIELPNLAIGDYVEYEYVMEHSPSDFAGFRSAGWVFQNFSMPFDLSRMVVLVPHDLPLTVDARGPVPPPEERRDGDLRVLTWTVRESRPLEREPRWAPRHAILPSLEFGVRSGWDGFFSAWRESLADRDRIDPAAVRLVHEILGPARDAPIEERARILRRWVTESIEAGGEFSGSAPLMVADRTGSRTRVLRYLLELAGADARLAMVRSYGDPEPTDLFDGGVYPSAIVVIDRGRGRQPLFVWAEDRGAPFDAIPVSLRGQEGVILAEGLPRVRIPDQPVETDGREALVDVEVRADGSAEISIVETIRGAPAASFRIDLENVPAAELEETFAGGYASRIVPGAELVSLAIEGRDEPEAPLVFRYRLAARRIGRIQGGRLVLPSFFEQGLAAAYAQLPARTTTELVWGVSHVLRLRVRGPNGTGSPSTGPDVRLPGPQGASYARVSSRQRNSLLIERRLTLPRMLIEPAQYGAFAAWCRNAEAADRTEVTLDAR